MKTSILILAVLLINAFASGCMNRATSLRMLDRRAEYEEDEKARLAAPALKEAGLDGFKNHPVPVRSRPKVVAVYIHPHETATRDYFWGGWLSVVVEKDQWILSKPGQMKEAPGVTPITND